MPLPAGAAPFAPCKRRRASSSNGCTGRPRMNQGEARRAIARAASLAQSVGDGISPLWPHARCFGRSIYARSKTTLQIFRIIRAGRYNRSPATTSRKVDGSGASAGAANAANVSDNANGSPLTRNAG